MEGTENLWCRRKVAGYIEKSLFKNIKEYIKANSKVNETFEKGLGVRQGCMMITLLPSRYINMALRLRQEMGREGQILS